ncbi:MULTISPECIES: DUF2846 domain-containing protein [Raoultella]|jgi:hypothetical protein|uniref:Uncharacterized protein DUF2846 n=1 Tax=Raoultella ornithinolytica TaxID=54291 RepID=A0ABD7QC83_RAOOR|nr:MULTISPECIES: DUF2846 domain-containing protein [Raoultella]TCQ69911.1 uncharacterized protein DUF2846 [Raoultella ornithinolytica]MCI1034518.1 DUF2846 domain-containing protein [Raoultella terrigena]MCS4270837.1 hypothetical protein [Raoultella sp. BIGb0132]MCS4287797.1 hypothetical protein [Raoultella terrigena]ROS02155.1 uncharacterized protein DUF2846 [Raoultella terrigena]
MNKIIFAAVILSSALLGGCASVPLASNAENATAKSFPAPESGKAGLYVYRDSFVGKALKKDVYLDGRCLGETADRVFFYQQISASQPHTLGTESEFSPNNLTLNVAPGKNYFVRQYIKMGVFVGGAGLEQVPESEGMRVVSKPEVKLAVPGKCDN